MFEPRIKSSLNHNPQNVPVELLKLVREAFMEKHTEFLKNRELSVEGAIYPEEIILLVGFKNKGSIRQLNFECSMDHTEEQNALDKIHRGIDAIDSMMTEYIENFKELDAEADSIDENEDMEFPKVWAEFTFEKLKLFLKTSTLNTDIEKMTEAFLKENDSSFQPSMEEGQDLH